MIRDSTPKILTARAGYSVDSANDRELSFNSDWPLLPIEAEGVFEVNDSLSAPVTIYSHGLGYAPLFKVFFEKDGYLYPTPDSTSAGLGSTCAVSSSNLVWRDVYFSETPMNLYWKIYRRPIEKNEDQAPYSLTAATTKKGGQGKIVIAMPGKDIKDGGPADISFNSNWGQLIIDSSKYALASTSDFGYYTLTIDHDLGYRPMYWAYYKDADNNEWRQMGSLDVYRAIVTTTSITWRISVGTWGGDTPTLALVLYKSTINSA